MSGGDFFGALLGNAGLNIAASGQRKAAKLCFEVAEQQRAMAHKLKLGNAKTWTPVKRWERLTQEEQETWIQAVGDKIQG